ncbi:NAD-dependent dehydratase [Pseudonocardia sp. EC080625-04]|uniref:SDR family oxidoreductase n=1 Tax=Pseudonocardia sp. EC080625-04 TaxID=1096868 RepID=UPI0006CB05C0|nr:SDR family oxidoreductase [Pseudonocardia sp. EC080625-04]ALE75566.1 NAD-dependent dehydratase [Pseudonocardia sp. EC080625-04]
MTLPSGRTGGTIAVVRYLVTGATGYIGGRLAPRLLGHGPEDDLTPDPASGPVQVRCLVRNPDKLADVPWAADAEIVRGDLLDPASVRAACTDVDVVYFLVHSLSDTDFAATDRRAALILGEAAREAGVKRIVYLGGLHPDDDPDELSAHLASRVEVGETLLRSGVPTVVLQAAVILGSGSASFEMLRHLTERLPVMVTPRWVHNRIQPIAVRDVLRYLIRVAEIPEELNRTFDIGGPDVLSYIEMMRRYAAVADLGRRRVLPVPVLSPALSAHWVNVVTPVPKSIAKPLIESLVHEVVCTENDIADHVPDPPGGLIGYERAVGLALARITGGEVETRWSGATVENVPSDPLPSDPDWAGGSVYLDEREQPTSVSPERLWTVIEGIGGERGWYSFPLAWSVRGWMDRAVGGVGLSRGRRDPDDLHTGDALDWWRVERLVEPGGSRSPGSDLGPQEGLLRLRAEMKVPGQAWLDMSVTPRDGGSTYHQRAVFIPHGLPGYLYWWSVAPFHGIVFGGMVRNITRTAERSGDDGDVPASRRPAWLRSRARRADRAA